MLFDDITCSESRDSNGKSTSPSMSLIGNNAEFEMMVLLLGGNLPLGSRLSVIIPKCAKRLFIG